MILKLDRSFKTRFLLSIALATAFTITPQAHAEQSALEAKLQRKVNQLSAQLEVTSTPNDALREELIGLMRDGVALLDVPFHELTFQGKLQNGNRALVALANAYTKKTKDPLMDSGPEGFLKLISEQNVFHPEKIEYIGLAARAYPHLGGSSGLQITNLVSRLLFEKAIESAPYESKHLDEALLLLNSAYPLADGRDGTKDYYQTLFLTLSSLNHEESLKALTTSLRSQQAKDPKHFGWVEEFLGSLETSLEETLKEALYQKEEIDLALRSIHEMNSGCAKEETEEPEDTAEALEPSGNFLVDRETESLKEELRSDNTYRQLRALKSLAQFEESKILEVFEGGELFNEVQDAFKLLDDASAIRICFSLLQKNSALEGEASDAIIELGIWAAPVFPALISRLKSPDADVRRLAVHILGKIGEKAAPAIPALIEALKDPDKDVRVQVALTLGKIGEKAEPAIPALIEAFNDPDNDVRVQVAMTLGWLGEKATPAIPALIEALKDPDKVIRVQVAMTLGWLGEKAVPAIPALIEALKDPDKDVRRQVAITLGYFEEKAVPAIPALIETLKDPDKVIRREVAIFLIRFGEKAAPAVPAIIEALKDPDKVIRVQVAHTLGEIGEKADLAIPALIEALKDPDKDVRFQVAATLSRFGEKADLVIPALIEALKDPADSVRSKAAWALGSFGEKAAPAVPAFTQIIFQEGENPYKIYYNRCEAIDVLTSIGHNALPTPSQTGEMERKITIKHFFSRSAH